MACELTNSDFFSGRLINLKKRLMKHIRHLIQFGFPKEKVKVGIESVYPGDIAWVYLPQEIIDSFPVLETHKEIEKMRQTLLAQGPKIWDKERGCVEVRGEVGISILSLMVKKACGEIMKKIGSPEDILIYNIKKGIRRVFSKLKLSIQTKRIKIEIKEGEYVRATIKVGNRRYGVLPKIIKFTANTEKDLVRAIEKYLSPPLPFSDSN